MYFAARFIIEYQFPVRLLDFWEAIQPVIKIGIQLRKNSRDAFAAGSYSKLVLDLILKLPT